MFQHLTLKKCCPICYSGKVSVSIQQRDGRSADTSFGVILNLKYLQCMEYIASHECVNNKGVTIYLTIQYCRADKFCKWFGPRTVWTKLRD